MVLLKAMELVMMLVFVQVLVQLFCLVMASYLAITNYYTKYNITCDTISPLVMASYLAIQLVSTVSLLSPSISGSVRIL